LTVFYLYHNDQEQGLWFPVNQYYKHVVRLNTDEITKRLRGAGFQPFGTAQDLYCAISADKGSDHYNNLFGVVQQIAKDLDATLG
jgi:hypothetical protein